MVKAKTKKTGKVDFPFDIPLVRPDFPATEEGGEALNAWVEERKPFARAFTVNDRAVYQHARIANNVRRNYAKTVKATPKGSEAREKQSDKAAVSTT